MNIGIVTWMGTGNFGTSLQSYALHKFLEQRGYSVYIIKEFGDDDFSILNKLKKNVRNIRQQMKTYINATLSKTNADRIHLFNKENYHVKVIKSEREKTALVENTDVFVTGSDQIWNCYHNFSPFMFLDFAGSKKRIAYASSIGTNDFPGFCAQEVKKLLNNFEHIGVREKSSAAFLKEFLGRKDVTQVLDPTFLLDSEDWTQFGLHAHIDFTIPNDYILCYFIGCNPNIEEQINKIREKMGIHNVILIPSFENSNLRFKDCLVYRQAGPYEFVNLLSNATVVCTDSFHACALSINLSKDFIVFKRFRDDEPQSQNNRIYDLLDIFHLKTDFSEASVINVTSEVSSSLSALRTRSMNFLFQSIEE